VYLLASTQVYPDLASGLSLAVIVLLLAVAEVRGRLTPLQLTSGALLLALLPWLHQQNAFYAVLLVVAVVVLNLRAKLPRVQAAEWLRDALPRHGFASPGVSSLPPVVLPTRLEPTC